MKLQVVWFGRKAPAWADAAWEDYARRMQRWVRLETRVLKPTAFCGDVVAVRDDEAARLLAGLGPRDRLVVLDERGDDLTTEAFRDLVVDGLRDTGGHLVFALGGPYGHGAAARDAAHLVVRLGAMVLNHQVARVVLVEQLYRALSLEHGVPYHH